VNAWSDDDGGPTRGAVWILFLDDAFCSDAIRNGGEQCDDGNLSGGDGCDHVCRIEVEDSWEFSGTAAGGTVSLSVEGFPLQVLTFAGETAAGVAANIADAINADPTLSTLGVFAFASENTVIVNGMISDRLIDDPGLNPPAVPALAGSRLALLAALLGITATMEVRSRARARGCSGLRRNLQEEAGCDN
jgi:cysteine-rich repeat protein